MHYLSCLIILVLFLHIVYMLIIPRCMYTVQISFLSSSHMSSCLLMSNRYLKHICSKMNFTICLLLFCYLLQLVENVLLTQNFEMFKMFHLFKMLVFLLISLFEHLYSVLSRDLLTDYTWNILRG